MSLRYMSTEKKHIDMRDFLKGFFHLSLLRHKWLRIAAGCFLFFLVLDVLLYLLFAMPAAAGLEQKTARYQELKRRQAEAALFLKQKREIAGLRDGIATQKDMPIMVRDIVQTAKRLGLSVSNMNYDISKRETFGLTMLSFTLPVQGAYPNLKRFIHEIETSERFIGIQDLSLDADRGKVNLNMKLVTYIRGY